MPEIFKNISRVNLRMRRGAVVFGDVIYKPGGICGPRVQRDYQLVVMHQGELNLDIDGERVLVPAGHAIMLSPHHREHFVFTRDGETRHSWCAIAPKAVPGTLRTVFRALRGAVPFGSRTASLMELGKTTFWDGRMNESLETGFHLHLALTLFCAFALEGQSGGNGESTGMEVVGKLRDFISSEYANPLSLADMAKATGVSRQHLLRLHRTNGLSTPQTCLFEKRLEAAADFLAHTGVPVGEIAERCGFANAFHFSRKFRDFYGASPRAWREELWTKKPGSRSRAGIEK